MNNTRKKQMTDYWNSFMNIEKGVEANVFNWQQIKYTRTGQFEN
jgi:hypothetical protein